jgi:hypothetical protein
MKLLMDDKTERNQRAYWTPSVEPVSGQLDIEPPKAKITGADRSRQPGRDLHDRDVSSSVQVADDGEVERVGGRRRFRPEVILMVAGAVFLVGALIKPWSSPAPARSDSTIATSPESTALVALGPADVQVGIPGDVTQGWSTVDWSVLGSTDPHSGWGIGAAIMPSLTAGLVDPNKTSPKTTWIAGGPLPAYSTMPIVHGLSVYAIALTWPSSLKVTSVTFQFVNGPDYPIGVTPPGFPEFAQVSPVPADAVASPLAKLTAGASARPSAVTSGSALKSGRFWIPPTDASLSAATATPAPADWQVLPWPWPNGDYWVRVTSKSGTTTLLFQLQQS